MHPLFFSVKRTFLSAQRYSRELLEEFDLADEITPTQLDVLRIVYERITVARWQLVELLGVVGPAVSKMLGRLEERGLIVRDKIDHDGRMVEVKITPHGEDVVKRAMQHICRPELEPCFFDVISKSTPPETNRKRLEELLLHARIGLEDRARFIHPWMRIDMSLGYSLENPPPPEAIHPPRDAASG